MPDPNNPDDGGAGGAAIDASNPEVQTLIAAAVKEATTGLAANKEEILAEKKALQAQMDEMGETWKGLDPEAVRNIMNRMENDEETKLLAEGKMDEVMARRTERLQADHQKQVDALTASLAERDALLEQGQGQVKRLTVSTSLQKAAADLGVHSTAFDDVLHRAMSVFEIDDGKPIVKENGATVFGKDGKSPMSPAEWLEAMKETAPHWFPAPSGGGAGGGAGGGKGAHQITREQARDVATYRAAREAASKAGVPLQIVAAS